MKRKRTLYLLSAICAVALIAMTFALVFGNKNQEDAEFVPPPFDASAVSGMPSVDDGSLSKIYQDGMSFTAYVCGKPVTEGQRARVFFTSTEDNGVWLKLRITDENGNIIGESGLIRPGEYVEYVSYSKQPRNGQKIKMKIMAYEPETYYSAGAIVLNTTVNGGE